MNSSIIRNDVQILRDKLSQIETSLQHRLPADKLATTVALMDALALQVVPGNLVDLTVEQLADFGAGLFDFVERRDQPSCSEYIDVPAIKCGFLVCNCVDVPYLFDALLLFLKQQHIDWNVVAHLCLMVERDGDKVTSIGDAQRQCADESVMIVQVESGACSPECVVAINHVLSEVICVDSDSARLKQRLQQLQPLAEEAGYSHFWQWLLDDNFMPLSYRQLQTDMSTAVPTFHMIDDESMGLSADVLNLRDNFDNCDPLVGACLTRKNRLVVVETDNHYPVWRNEPYTAIYVRQNLGEDGSQNEDNYIEHIFFGLYQPETRQVSALNVPALREKIDQALSRLNIASCTYNYRKIEELLAKFPKTELFFLSADQLDEIIKSLLFFNYASIRVVALDNELNSLSLLLIIPRNLSPNADFSKLESHLQNYFKADSFMTRILQFSNDHYIVRVNINRSEEINLTDIETLNATLTSLMQSWEQKLRAILVTAHGAEHGHQLWHRYADVFCSNYRAIIHPHFCAADIFKLEQLLKTGDEQVELWGPEGDTDDSCRLQFYCEHQEYLNELMPVLVNLNLTIIDEMDFTVSLDGKELFIKSFGVLNALPGKNCLLQVKPRLLAALTALRTGIAENDYLNQLLVGTDLDWQQIDVFRGYRNYYFQLGSAFTKKTVAYALINNPRSAMALYRYFEARFMPKDSWQDMMIREEQALFPARMALIDALQDVSDVNEDRILRTVFNLIDSTVRTNFFLRKNCEQYFFSFKISAIGITEMPVPRPLYEVYVHNSTMEGIHLRGGMVARGGIRWSDRPDDFRTEILGLMKTQMTKNALIVPVGSKGGFVIKESFSSREEGMALSKLAYQTLMRGLLDLTDNRVAGKIVAAKEIVCYDSNDPYLVVAADKGTAHLPDTANGVSEEYNFWLGDGFASGGSRGYDHKVLGITARGAWVSVQRHFREMGIDIQNEPFSVVGIGDMSGDVFGNGMLLSEQICLKAAFNHLHIFLDPDPDPVASFTERQRLFNLPRSSWGDYDAALISEGGGIFERDAKEIPLSPQVQQWLGVRHNSLDPDSLIQLLLQAEVDLLWNGGIGTYVKASSQKHEDAGDRANDVLRVNGNQLRAKVVGEGGNLGMTQLARIEYAFNGGHINTDAVDNSAGVDCSDHEVNLKIFMQHLMEAGHVSDIDNRDELLGAVTDHVCQAVLDNNYGQSLSLSLDTIRNQVDRELFVDLSARLVEVGLLNRQSEVLPSTKEILGRKQGYTRPELSILMAYSKMQLYQAILDDPDFANNDGDDTTLASYFPEPIQQQFSQQLADHPLRREIVATVTTNNVIDCAGATFCFSMARLYDISLPQAAAAHGHFSTIIGAAELRKNIYALDNKVPSAVQYQLLIELETAIKKMCDWAFSHNPELLAADQSSALQQYFADMLTNLSDVMGEDSWQQCQTRQTELQNYGIAEEVALRLVSLAALEKFLPMVALIKKLDCAMPMVASSLNEVKSSFALDIVLNNIQNVVVRDRWDRMTQHLLMTRFNFIIFKLAHTVLENYSGNVGGLLSAQRHGYQRYMRLVDQVENQAAVNFHPYVVVYEQLNSMC